MQISKTKTKTIITAVILILSACITIYINYIHKTPAYDISLYILGSLYYILFMIINKMDNQINLDYIQTGEAFMGSFLIYIITRFFTENIFNIFLYTLISFIFIELFLKKVLQSRKTEQFRQGFSILFIVACILTFLHYRDPFFDLGEVLETTAGYMTTVHFNKSFLYINVAFVIISCIILFLLLPEISLFSYGKSYSIYSGGKNFLIQFIIIFLRSLFLTMTILLLGWMSGIGIYVLFSSNKIKKIFLPLIIIIYSQYLLLLINSSFHFYSIILTISISYLTYFIYKKKRLVLYGNF